METQINHEVSYHGQVPSVHASSPYANNTVADDAGEAARMQAQAWRHIAPLLAQAVRVWSWRCAA